MVPFGWQVDLPATGEPLGIVASEPGMVVSGNVATTILIVEDELFVRLAASDELAEQGFTVVEATNGATGLKVLESRSDVKLLFTDVVMPGELDGLALADLVHDRWPDVRVLVTSAVHTYADRVPDGASFISKPYTYEALLCAVNALLAQPDEKPEQGSRFVPQSHVALNAVEDGMAVAQPVVVSPSRTSAGSISGNGHTEGASGRLLAPICARRTIIALPLLINLVA